MKTSLRNFCSSNNFNVLSRAQLKNVVGGNSICTFNLQGGGGVMAECSGYTASQCRDSTVHNMKNLCDSAGDKYGGGLTCKNV